VRTDITAKVIASSESPQGIRLDTLQLRYPRIIHAEFMTHRQFSRNASSTRAIPINSFLARDEIFVPEFTKNKPGMQADGLLDPEKATEAEAVWRRMAQACADGCAELAKLGVHKQHGGRPLEWFGYIDVVVSSTEWSNWDGLRDHEAAQPEIIDLARAIKKARSEVEPKLLAPGHWHLPYVDDETYGVVGSAFVDGSAIDLLRRVEFAFTSDELATVNNVTRLLVCISAARCCRVSYAKHDGTPSTLEEDINRFVLLAGSTPMHASPLEHQARIGDDMEFYFNGNFDGDWQQFRKFIPYECL